MFCTYERLEDGRLRCSQCGDQTSLAHADAPIRICGSAPPQVPPPGFGPGTELKAILKRIGFKTCGACELMASRMDHWGVDGCEEHRAAIIAWLRQQRSEISWRE